MNSNHTVTTYFYRTSEKHIFGLAEVTNSNHTVTTYFYRLWGKSYSSKRRLAAMVTVISREIGVFWGLSSTRFCNGYCYFPGDRGVLGLYSTCVCKDYCKCPGKWNILGHKKSTPAPEMPFFPRGIGVFGAIVLFFPPECPNFPENNSNHCKRTWNATPETLQFPGKKQ